MKRALRKRELFKLPKTDHIIRLITLSAIPLRKNIFLSHSISWIDRNRFRFELIFPVLKSKPVNSKFRDMACKNFWLGVPSVSVLPKRKEGGWVGLWIYGWDWQYWLKQFAWNIDWTFQATRRIATTARFRAKSATSFLSVTECTSSRRRQRPATTSKDFSQKSLTSSFRFIHIFLPF